MKRVKVKSTSRDEMIDITKQVAEVVSSCGKATGICTVFVQHTTCGVTVNENADPDVQHDMLLFLRELIPQYREGFRHFEHNSDSHIKASLMGSSVSVPFEVGRLVLGRWQGIYLCEFDGPRERSVVVSVT